MNKTYQDLHITGFMVSEIVHKTKFYQNKYTFSYNIK